MSEQKDGGSAFPVVHPNPRVDHPYVLSSGMSLRDYFAGQALASFAGNEAAGLYFNRDTNALAANCYKLADAMLKAREP